MSESDGDAEMMMIMSIQEEMDREVGRILNFKGMIKGRRVFNQDRVDGGRLLYKDYFKPGPTVPDNFFADAFVCKKKTFSFAQTLVLARGGGSGGT